MNQKLAVSSFSGGLATFFAVGVELLKEHTWADLTGTPLGAFHLFVLGCAFVIFIGGAIGIQLPRTSGPHGDRRDDAPV